ncbi:MAG: hypothetical protein ACP5JU_03660 [Minisyncoccia bacterium]
MNFYIEDILVGFEFINFSECVFSKYSYFSFIGLLKFFRSFYDTDFKKKKSISFSFDKSYILKFEIII